MRLICPNCGAQYEVDGSMIPDEGRDVQCSSCGQTWFQPPEGEAPAVLSETEPEEAVTSDGPTEPEPPHSDVTTPEVTGQDDETLERAPVEEAAGPSTDALEPDEQTEETRLAADDHAEIPSEAEAAEDLSGTEPDTADEPIKAQVKTFSEGLHDGDLEDDSPDDVAAEVAESKDDLPPPPSERLDENILGILKEEAAREVEARRMEEASGLEMQPDLGLDDAASEETDRPAVAAHMARMRASTDENGETSPAGARSDLLPDIEEINSSLRPASEHAEVTEVQDPVMVEGKRKRGFRSGFTLMIVIAAVLVLAYVFAPQIAEQVPALRPVLTGYVDAANSVRDGIDGMMSRSVEAINGDANQ